MQSIGSPTRKRAGRGDFERALLFKRSRLRPQLEDSMANVEDAGGPVGMERRHFRVKTHSEEAFRVLFSLLENEELTDVTLLVGEETYRAHKVVLASCSPYLRAMFTIGMRESQENEIELKELKSDVMGLIIRYMYTGEAEVTVDNVQDVLAASNMLQLLDLKQACSSFLRHHIDAANCLGIWSFSEMHCCPELMREAEEFIFRKFADVCQHEEFLMLGYEELVKLVSSDKLRVKEEKQVFDATLNWLNYNLEERHVHTTLLLETIRLRSIPHAYLARKLESEPAFSLCSSASFFLKGFIQGVSSTKDEVRGSFARAPVEMLYVIGGRNKLRCLNTVERYCPDLGHWEMLPAMLDVRTAVGVASLGGKLYAVGGECECRLHRERTMYLNTVECYDPISNEWTYAASMQCSRSFAAVVSLEGVYDVVGNHGYSVKCQYTVMLST